MQYCTNCGEHLNENQQFCPNCGHPVAQRAATPSSAGAGNPKTSKKRRWVVPVIVISCVLAVLLVALLVAGYLLLGWFRAPHERLIMYKNVIASSAVDEIRDIDYDTAVSTDSELRFDVSDVTLPDYVDSAVYYLSGMDAATLLNAASAEINMDFDSADGRCLTELLLSLSGTQLMGYTVTADDNGVGLYADSTDRYGIMTWDTLDMENPLSMTSQISPDKAADLLLALSDAFDALLTEDSVSYQRNYRAVVMDSGEVKMNRYVVDPGRSEWKDFLIRIADLIESDPVVSELIVAYANESGYGSNTEAVTAAGIADQIRQNASDTAKWLAASDIEFHLFVSGKQLCHVTCKLADDDTEIVLNLGDCRTKSEGLRTFSLDVDRAGASLLSISVENTYELNAKAEEEGKITGAFAYPDNEVSGVISGTYDTSSNCAVKIDITDYSDDTTTLYLDHAWRGDEEAKKGTLTIGMDAPYADGKLALTVEYDIDMTRESVLHVPYGSYELLMSLSGTPYDDTVNGTTLTLDVSGSKTGSVHRLTVQGLIVDDIEIRDAAVILTTSDQPTTATYPSAVAEYGDSNLLSEILQGGLPADLW